MKAGTRMEEGQYIRIPPLVFNYDKKKNPEKVILKPNISKLDAKNLQKSVVYQDDDIIILNKPSGLAVQGGSRLNKNLDDMLDALRFEKSEKPRLVHRLDKDTSGTLLLARHVNAARTLTQAFKTKVVRKVYWAIVIGRPGQLKGMIDMKLEKQFGVGGEKVIASLSVGKEAQTIYRIVDHVGDKAAWIVFEPLTGRTHQLRAHAVALGTPILGDGKYGQRKAFLKNDQIENRLHLHARGLRFPHPAGHIMETLAPIPDHFKKTFRALGFDVTKEKEPFEGSNI